MRASQAQSEQQSNIRYILQGECLFSNNPRELLVSGGITTCFGVSIRDKTSCHIRGIAHLDSTNFLDALEHPIPLDKLRVEFEKIGGNPNNCAITFFGGSPSLNGQVNHDNVCNILKRILGRTFPVPIEEIKYTKSSDDYLEVAEKPIETVRQFVKTAIISSEDKTLIGYYGDDKINEQYTVMELFNGVNLDHVDCLAFNDRKQFLAKVKPKEILTPEEVLQKAANMKIQDLLQNMEIQRLLQIIKNSGKKIFLSYAWAKDDSTVTMVDEVWELLAGSFAFRVGNILSSISQKEDETLFRNKPNLKAAWDKRQRGIELDESEAITVFNELLQIIKARSRLNRIAAITSDADLKKKDIALDAVIEEFIESNDYPFIFRSNVGVYRDIQGLNHLKAKVRDFMNNSYHAIFVCFINDAYLKSPNCMYEAEQALDGDHSKIFPIIYLSHNEEHKKRRNIFQLDNKIEYLFHWKNEYEKLDKKIRELGSTIRVDNFKK
jgi:hypothetical protein